MNAKVPAELAAPVSVPETKAPRGARRKRDTRAKLLGAALHLMAYRGVAGVRINEITEQADVGFGSFYNHFESKEAIYATLIDEVIGHFAVALDKLGEQLNDPAEKIAASTRYTLLRGQADPVWGRFVFQTNFSRDSMSHGLGRYLLQDIGSGVSAGRFTVADLPSVYIAVGSTILGGLAALSDRTLPDHEPDILGDAQGLSVRIAAILLTILGLSTQEAQEIANRPLPQIELPANPFAQV
ncbi:TetR/AcrR family transcriptional regulator [Aquabacterium sp.]|uniref:TetR/AcrR family transcriptional regulator n=1 Tax=Aquabacterium sp. TaxID=1872578 RepID=UPI003D6CC738